MRALFHLDRRPSPQLGEPFVAKVAELREATLAAAYYSPRVGGDLYDFLRVGPTRFLFGLLDVAGRFEENREIRTAAERTFRQAGAQLFQEEDINPAEAMIELCLRLNRTILEARRGVCYCSAFLGCYEEGLGTVWYANQGHTPALVHGPAGVSELPATGLPLGLFSHTTCDASAIALEPGAALLVVSRGIVEAKRRGEELGLESVKTRFHEIAAANAKDICLSILTEVQEFMSAPPTHNDVTALALTQSFAQKAASPPGL